MNSQAIKQNLSLYISLEETRARLNQELFEICNQKRIIEKAVEMHVPEDFVVSHKGKFYRFLMDIDDGGIRNFAEVEDLDTWLSQQEAIAPTTQAN